MRTYRTLGALLLIVLGGACGPSTTSASPEDSGSDLSGIWQLRVEDLSIWAPRYTLVKATGRIHWKIAIVDDELSLLEYEPDSKSPHTEYTRPADGLFEQVEVREVIIRNDLIAFKVAGTAGAYEAYWLEQFSEDKILGTYTVYDRYGGGPGSGPEYKARLILQRVD